MTEYLTNTFKNDDLDEDFEAVSNQSLHDLLETITSVPHLAGDFQDLILADFVRQKFVEFGLDHAEVYYFKMIIALSMSIILCLHPC